MARFIQNGDIIKQKGFTFRVNIESDDANEAPWEREDGHGPVSESHYHPFGRGSKPPKKAGERLLCWDDGYYRTYDFSEAVRIAKRDAWGLSSANVEALAARLGHSPSRNEIVAEAVERDFKRLQDWCEDRWRYVGVAVTHIPDDEESEDVKTGYGHALWGIESDCDDYLAEVAGILMDEIINDLTAEKEKEWAVNKAEQLECEACANMNIATIS